ncbi:MAG TPA: hypothetical protein VFY83_00215 [Anaerolineales bacterium]|nr:hypothetical protein [Anaerolineales bacterium]
MFKISFATRVISFAVLITLLLASFPTAVAAAKDNNRGLEAKWAKLVDIYNRQSTIHNSAPRWVAQWMSDHRRAPARKKAELQKDLAISNEAWAPVPSIVMRHNGFDTQGNVVDKAAARQSVKDLSKALQRYKASIKNLKAFLRQYSMEG